MDSDHSFDQKGFRFAGKIFLACVVVGAVEYFGWWHVSEWHLKSVPSSFVTAVQEALNLSTTTPQRIINTLTIAGVVPQTGKFIAADLSNMKLTLYQDGAVFAEYSILTKGNPSSPYETPSGFYSVLTKESNHLNVREQIYMPYSMQFYGNYFIHGWPYYMDGTPVASTYSGGCIRLSTNDAEKVFEFAEKGTGIFVYDPILATPMSSLVISSIPIPSVSAGAYLIADIDTGDVFLEQNAQKSLPIASVTKLMTALVANETIMFNNKIEVTHGELLYPQDDALTTKETFVVGDLLYPLLMESNNAIADRLAQYYGAKGFVDWMNTTAKALGMQSTHFADASGVSAENTSTPDDLFRFATYLANKKSFILDITRTPTKNLIADGGDTYHFSNFNIFSDSANFIGGKVGQTTAAQETMASVFSVPVNGVARRVAIIVLKSDNYTTDTKKLADWFTQSAQQGTALAGTACVSCAVSPHYRKIQN
jgi:D-alanyl-D-alanine carboxypeptidase